MCTGVLRLPVTPTKCLNCDDLLGFDFSRCTPTRYTMVCVVVGGVENSVMCELEVFRSSISYYLLIIGGNRVLLWPSLRSWGQGSRSRERPSGVTETKSFETKFKGREVLRKGLIAVRLQEKWIVKLLQQHIVTCYRFLSPRDWNRFVVLVVPRTDNSDEGLSLKE